jgi:hypothetical protein
MKAMLGIPLYGCLFLKLAKMLSFLFSLMFSLQQNWRTRRWNQFLPGSQGVREGMGWGEEMAQTMYAHVNK